MVDKTNSINLKSSYIASCQKTQYRDVDNEKTCNACRYCNQHSSTCLYNVSTQSTLPDDSHKGENLLNNDINVAKDATKKTTSLTTATWHRNNLDSTQHSPRRGRCLSGCERRGSRRVLARLRRASSWLFVVCCFPLWFPYCFCIREDPGADYLTEDELNEELAQDWCMPCYYRGYRVV